MTTSDHSFAEHIRAELHSFSYAITETRMFGGVGFMVGGNMGCAASKRGLLVRVDADAYDELIARPGADVMVMRDRPMDGWLRISPEACSANGMLLQWARIGLDYAASLPAK